MKYLYYPGCSLEGTAIEYHTSSKAVMQALGMELEEIEDWTCCGASAAEVVSPLLSFVLPARNLALAERSGVSDQVVAPCSSCYLNLKKADEKIRTDEKTRKAINSVLNEDDLSCSGKIRVRHLLDVLSNDVGPGKIGALVAKRLSGLIVAPYYGCQALRPYTEFDDPERPVSMEPLIKATGAEIHRWSSGGKCCGAGLMTTKPPIALDLTAEILKDARGADCIVTVCPMCQMNLEYYQKKISGRAGTDLGITVLYLPQLIGLALGTDVTALGISRSYAVESVFLRKINEVSTLPDTR